MSKSHSEVRTVNGGRIYKIQFNFIFFAKAGLLPYMPTVIFVAIGVMAYLDDERTAAYTMWALGECILMSSLSIIRITAKRNLKTNKMYANMKNIYYRFDLQGMVLVKPLARKSRRR